MISLDVQTSVLIKVYIASGKIKFASIHLPATHYMSGRGLVFTKYTRIALRTLDVSHSFLDLCVPIHFAHFSIQIFLIVSLKKANQVMCNISGPMNKFRQTFL